MTTSNNPNAPTPTEQDASKGIAHAITGDNGAPDSTKPVDQGPNAETADGSINKTEIRFTTHADIVLREPFARRLLGANTDALRVGFILSAAPKDKAILIRPGDHSTGVGMRPETFLSALEYWASVDAIALAPRDDGLYLIRVLEPMTRTE